MTWSGETRIVNRSPSRGWRKRGRGLRVRSNPSIHCETRRSRRLLTNKFGDGTGGKTRFDGQTVDDTTVIVKFTHRVDVDLDLDGFVTPNDAIIFATFYNGTLPSLPEPGGTVLILAGLLSASLRRRRPS
jgi:hypothetical protein